MSDLTFSISTASDLTGIPRKAVTEIVASLPEDASVEQLVAAFVTAVRTETASVSRPDAAPKADGLYSQLALADLFGTYSQVVKKALKGITPAVNKPKLKQYRLTQKNKAGKTVKELLEALQDSKLSDVKTRSALAEAELREIKVQTARRELVPYAEVRDELQRLVHHLYQLLAVKQPRDLAGRLIMCKSSRDAAALLKRETSKAFDDLRNNYKRLFRSA